jgi:hypothetical protein
MNKDNKDLLIKVGIIAAAGIFIVRPLLVKLGLARNKAERDLANATQQAFTDNVNNFRNLKPTKSNAQWQMIADIIYNDLRYSSLDDNKDDATYQICRVQNDLDLAILMKAFNVRQEYFFGIPAGDPQSLAQFVVSNLSDKQRAIINSNISRKGLKFRF